MNSRRLAPLVGVALAAVASAQITLTDLNMEVTSAAPSAVSNLPRTFDLRSDALAFDQGFEHWWYFRVAGDIAESALRSLGGVTGGVAPGGVHGDRDFQDLDLRGLLKASHDLDVYSAGPASGVLISRLTVMNISNTAQTVDLFAYTDVDVAGSFGDDQCTATVDRHLVTDPSGILIDVRGPGADRSDVLAYPVVRTALSNLAVDDLGNNLAPFAGDYTGAFQWSAQVLQPFEERTFTVVMAVDTAANAVPTVENFGAGNGATFQIHATDLPLQDNAQLRSFSVRMKGGLPNALHRIVAGLAPWNALPFIPGIDLWVEPASLIAVYGGFTDAGGNAEQFYFIPPAPYFTGFTAYFQCFYVDAAAPNGFAYFTPGMAIRIGKL